MGKPGLETREHKELKAKACHILARNRFREIHVEYQTKNRWVDVVGFEERGEKGSSVAIECGDCTLKTLEDLSPDFTWVYHLTWQGELKEYPSDFDDEMEKPEKNAPKKTLLPYRYKRLRVPPDSCL